MDCYIQDASVCMLTNVNTDTKHNRTWCEGHHATVLQPCWSAHGEFLPGSRQETWVRGCCKQGEWWNAGHAAWKVLHVGSVGAWCSQGGRWGWARDFKGMLLLVSQLC